MPHRFKVRRLASAMRMDRGVQGYTRPLAPIYLVQVCVAGSKKLNREAPGEAPPASSTLFQCRAIRYAWIARHLAAPTDCFLDVCRVMTWLLNHCLNYLIPRVDPD